MENSNFLEILKNLSLDINVKGCLKYWNHNKISISRLLFWLFQLKFSRKLIIFILEFFKPFEYSTVNSYCFTSVLKKVSKYQLLRFLNKSVSFHFHSCLAIFNTILFYTYFICTNKTESTDCKCLSYKSE